MKITRKQLRKLIAEAREFKVKTVSPEQYAADVASLPPSMRDLADGPRGTETPSKRHVVGNFFMTKGVDYKPPRGYSGLARQFNFYMILPDGEAISIDRRGLIISKTADGMRYLNLLNQNVTPLPLDSLSNAEKMQKQVENAIAMFRQGM